MYRLREIRLEVVSELKRLAAALNSSGVSSITTKNEAEVRVPTCGGSGRGGGPKAATTSCVLLQKGPSPASDLAAQSKKTLAPGLTPVTLQRIFAPFCVLSSPGTSTRPNSGSIIAHSAHRTTNAEIGKPLLSGLIQSKEMLLNTFSITRKSSHAEGTAQVVRIGGLTSLHWDKPTELSARTWK
eukprot:CAMPEP_0115746094 /NCGR_PEP_ID=MMETSP0272-20121206/92457_1 /TAXON_ID=71861 /ORGANISM="Scrippsiella trochoidea, Strain CCMP3099" /LENGTH=183 /DNA_ID=CAMNT_0003191019 /DNA_START=17 /DNA_END=572 /DNA_ORIENTATION=-